MFTTQHHQYASSAVPRQFAYHGIGFAFSAFVNPNEDCRKVSDSGARRRIQNRINQRNRRKKLKSKNLRRHAGASDGNSSNEEPGSSSKSSSKSRLHSAPQNQQQQQQAQAQQQSIIQPPTMPQNSQFISSMHPVHKLPVQSSHNTRDYTQLPPLSPYSAFPPPQEMMDPATHRAVASSHRLMKSIPSTASGTLPGLTTLGLTQLTASQLSLSRLERLPLQLLTQISYLLGYQNVISLSMTNRRFSKLHQDGYLKSSWEDKFTFVLEKERNLKQKTTIGGSGSEFPDFACYMCFRIKSADEFASTHLMVGYVQVISVHPQTEATSYRPLVPASSVEDLDVGTQASVPTSYACGSFASPTPALLRSSVNEAPIPPPPLKYRASQPGEAEMLRNYCIQCGIESGLHPEGEIIERRLSQRKFWTCRCGNLYNENQLHRCARCKLFPHLSRR